MTTTSGFFDDEEDDFDDDVDETTVVGLLVVVLAVVGEGKTVVFELSGDGVRRLVIRWTVFGFADVVAVVVNVVVIDDDNDVGEY